MDSLFTIRIPKKMKQELEAIKRSEGTDLADIVRDSLLRVIALHKLKGARTKMLPFAERLGIFTDEDVFEKFRS